RTGTGVHTCSLPVVTPALLPFFVDAPPPPPPPPPAPRPSPPGLLPPPPLGPVPPPPAAAPAPRPALLWAPPAALPPGTSAPARAAGALRGGTPRRARDAAPGGRARARVPDGAPVRSPEGAARVADAHGVRRRSGRLGRLAAPERRTGDQAPGRVPGGGGGALH